ncbi:hypothetical protein D3C73_1590310 [compost metagenome]
MSQPSAGGSDDPADDVVHVGVAFALGMIGIQLADNPQLLLVKIAEVRERNRPVHQRNGRSHRLIHAE